jgi:hypothetical protein
VAFNRASASTYRAFVGYNSSSANAVIQGVGGKGIEFNVNNDTFGSGTAMTINSSGNVGIGTTSPSKALHILSNAEAMLVDGSSTWGAALQIAGGGSARTYQLQSTGSGASEGTGKFLIVDKNASSATRFAIDSSGNVGIGTTSPSAKLDVTGTDTTPVTAGIRINTPNYPQLTLYSSAAGTDSKYWRLIGRSDGSAQIQTLNDSLAGEFSVISMRRSGSVGIGMTPDATYALDVNGPARFNLANGAGHATLWTFWNGCIYWNLDGLGGGCATWTASSRRFKEHIGPLDLDTNRLFDLRPVSFNWKKERGGYRDFGLIAEDVDKVYPMLVTHDQENKPFSVRYDLLSVLLLGQMQQAKKLAEQQSSEIRELREEIKSLKASIH